MDQYSDIWIKTCPICLSTKRKHPTKLKIPMGTIQASKTWELLSIDLWEAGVMSDRGHRYVLTVIDGFSKFALAIPIKNKKAETIASKLYRHVFAPFGYPDRLHSDNGLEFCNQILNALCAKLNIKKCHTTAYHPQGNAFAERIHQYFRNALAAFVGRDQRDWDLLIPGLIQVYQTAIHSALGGFSPAQVMFGRRMNDPNTPQRDIKITSEIPNIPSYVAKLTLALDRVQVEVTKLIKEKNFKNIQPSLGKLTLSYDVGDKVGLEVESLPAGVKSTKLFPRYAGPYTIVKSSQGGKVLYLADINGKQRKVPVSIQKIKPWPDRQTLLEQFEKFEISRRKSRKIPIPPVSKEPSPMEMEVENQISSRNDKIENNDVLYDPDDYDIMGNPLNKSNLGIIDDEFYNPDDYDIMGNLIISAHALRARIQKKLEKVSESMFMIETKLTYYNRSLPGINNSISTTPLDQHLFYLEMGETIGENVELIDIIII